uniref:Uncharacterized protein n=1 Tax=Kalanchoe fedtschenkoi TaxID=63787 RepID=A0A7N0TPU5_KALFE
MIFRWSLKLWAWTAYDQTNFAGWKHQLEKRRTHNLHSGANALELLTVIVALWRASTAGEVGGHPDDSASATISGIDESSINDATSSSTSEERSTSRKESTESKIDTMNSLNITLYEMAT